MKHCCKLKIKCISTMGQSTQPHNLFIGKNIRVLPYEISMANTFYSKRKQKCIPQHHSYANVQKVWVVNLRLESWQIQNLWLIILYNTFVVTEAIVYKNVVCNKSKTLILNYAFEHYKSLWQNTTRAELEQEYDINKQNSSSIGTNISCTHQKHTKPFDEKLGAPTEKR